MYFRYRIGDTVIVNDTIPEQEDGCSFVYSMYRFRGRKAFVSGVVRRNNGGQSIPGYKLVFAGENCPYTWLETWLHDLDEINISFDDKDFGELL